MTQNNEQRGMADGWINPAESIDIQEKVNKTQEKTQSKKIFISSVRSQWIYCS